MEEAVVVTRTTSDLKEVLAKDADEKQITLAPYLRQFISLTNIFPVQEFISTGVAKSSLDDLSGMMKIVKVDPEGM